MHIRIYAILGVASCVFACFNCHRINYLNGREKKISMPSETFLCNVIVLKIDPDLRHACTDIIDRILYGKTLEVHASQRVC